MSYKNCIDLHIPVGYMMTPWNYSVRFWRLSVRALVTNPGHSFFLFMGYNSQQQSPSLFPQNHTGDMHSIFFFFFLMHLFLLFYFYLWNCILFGLYYSSEKCISLKFDWEQSYKQNIFEIYYSIIGCEAKILNFCFSIDFS